MSTTREVFSGYGYLSHKGSRNCSHDERSIDVRLFHTPNGWIGTTGWPGDPNWCFYQAESRGKVITQIKAAHGATHRAPKTKYLFIFPQNTVRKIQYAEIDWDGKTAVAVRFTEGTL